MLAGLIALIICIPLIKWCFKSQDEPTCASPPEEPLITSPPSLIFRPNTFDQYIGQTYAKDILRRYIYAMLKRNQILPHVLIHGKAGMGKTTLARIIAKELGVSIIELITSELYIFQEILPKIRATNGGILFLDEIHSLNRDNAEKFYSIMEDFTFNGQSVPPFTLIGATTELGEIIKNRKPFYDRFKIIIELEDYKQDELVTIAKQYSQTVFPIELVPEPIYASLAENSRNTPRHLIRLLEATIYFDMDLPKVLQSFRILKKGYTEKDLKILKYIVQNDKGVGLQGLASYLDTSTANYLHEIEPYLLMNNAILRTPRGRKITQAGMNLITELERR